jgi:hypothetical protein
MTELIVDAREVVQIEDQHCGRVSVRRALATMRSSS